MSDFEVYDKNTSEMAATFAGSDTPYKSPAMTPQTNFSLTAKSRAAIYPNNTNGSPTFNSIVQFRLEKYSFLVKRMFFKLTFGPVTWTGATRISFKNYFLQKFFNNIRFTYGTNSDIAVYDWLDELVSKVWFMPQDDQQRYRIKNFYELPSPVYREIAKNGGTFYFLVPGWQNEAVYNALKIQSCSVDLFLEVKTPKLEALLDVRGPVVGTPLMGGGTTFKIETIYEGASLTNDITAEISKRVSMGITILTLNTYRQTLPSTIAAGTTGSVSQELRFLRGIRHAILFLFRYKDDLNNEIDLNFPEDAIPTLIHIYSGQKEFLKTIDVKQYLQECVAYHDFPRSYLDKRVVRWDISDFPDKIQNINSNQIDFGTANTTFTVELIYNSPPLKDVVVDVIQLGKNEIQQVGSEIRTIWKN